jgi:hypothetical protein
MNTQFFPPSDSAHMAARDRLLLYTRGMDIDPEGGLALALESLRRAGPDAEPEKAMRELFALIQESGHSPLMPGENDQPLVSAPPMSRVTLLPRDMEPLSFSAAVKKWIYSLVSPQKHHREGRS